MSIVAGELKLYKAAQNSNTAGSNGGVMSYNEVVTGVNNNLFPDVSQAERTAGVTHFRKVFYRNLNDETPNLPLLNARVFLENYTPADDAVYFHVGSFTNLQSGLTGSEDLYGCGKLDANAAATDTSIDVLIEQVGVNYFRVGDIIRISNKATVDASGDEEFHEVDSMSVAGSVVTLNLVGALANSYLASNTRVANVYEYGTVEAEVATVVATTVGDGDFDHVTYPIEGRNLGSVEDDWTITFTSATAFNVVGTRTGALAAGSTLSDYMPANPANSSPYFVIPLEGWTGTWASGDTLTFTTHPAAIPLWMKRVVPAGSAAYSGDKAVLAIDGETS